MPDTRALAGSTKWVRRRAPRVLRQAKTPAQSAAQASVVGKLEKEGMADFGLRMQLVKEAINKKKRQQHTHRKMKMKQPPKASYESPVDYVRRLYGDKDPGAKQTARARARAAGKKQPYTVRARIAGEPRVKPQPTPGTIPKAKPRPSSGTVNKTVKRGLKSATKAAPKWLKYGLPAVLGAGAITAGGLMYREDKKHKDFLKGYFKKTAMAPENPAADLAGIGGTLVGLKQGLSVGRGLAGHTAAGLAPYGRVTRSEDLARKAAFIGAPAGSIAALALGRKYGLGRKAAALLARKAPRGIIGNPSIDQAVLKGVLPIALGMGGGAVGGLATGGLIGGVQKLRGSPFKEKSAMVAGFFDEMEKISQSPMQQPTPALGAGNQMTAMNNVTPPPPTAPPSAGTTPGPTPGQGGLGGMTVKPPGMQGGLNSGMGT